MSDQKEPPAANEQAALTFTRDHLAHMQKSLRTTRIVACVLVGFVFLYMSYIASRLRSDMTHESLSSLLVSKGEAMVNEYVPPMIADVQKRLPELIRTEAPKYITSLLPELRAGLQSQATGFFDKALADIAPQLDQAITDLIGHKKDEVRAYLDTMKEVNAASPERKLVLEQRARGMVRLLVTELLDSLDVIAEQRQFGNPDLDFHYRNTLSMLRAGNQDLKHLATSKKLSPDDTDLSYAIAVLLKKVSWTSPVLTPPPKSIRQPKSGNNNATKPVAPPTTTKAPEKTP